MLGIKVCIVCMVEMRLCLNDVLRLFRLIVFKVVSWMNLILLMMLLKVYWFISLLSVCVVVL